MRQKRITILCNTFPPELGAAASRLWQMALVLKEAGYRVTVITVLPNYPTGKIFKEYRHSFFQKEEKEDLTIYRMRIYPSNSPNPIKRVVSMGSHVLSLFTTGLWRMLMSQADLMIINTPSVVNGFTGSLLSQLFTKTKVVLNVSDLYPHTAHALGVLKEGRRYDWLKKMERRMYQRADAFLTQSEEILRHIEELEGKQKPALVYRNLKPEAAHALPQLSTQNKIVYAGLIGVAQGVVAICEAIDFAACHTELHIYGEGAERKALEAYIAAHPDRGVYYHGVLPESEISERLSQYQALLVPLIRPIKGAVPSKIFMGIAHRLPILFMGDGEPQHIVQKQKIGWTCAPADFDTLRKNIESFAQCDEACWQELQENLATAQTLYNKPHQDHLLIQFLEPLLQG